MRGKPKAIIGIIIVVIAVVLCEESIEIAPRQRPMKRLPESPMKMDAGAKL